MNQCHTNAMNSSPARLVRLAILLFTLPATSLADVTLGSDSVLQFASRQTASAILAADDEYTSRMSQFDRMLRLKSTEPVSTAAYYSHMADNARDWTDTDRARLAPLLERLSDALDRYRLPLPPVVLLVKSSGNEEVGEGHTRANAIVLPLRSLYEDDDTLFFLLAHELFHVMTRHDAHFRNAAYALVGFRIGPELRLPAAIAPLQITNPDAPRHDSFVEVRSGGSVVEVVPVLLSRSAVFDPEIGDELERYWTLRLLVVEQASPGNPPVAKIRNGAPVLLRLRDVTGFFEKVGRNTRYVIHAEEVLAENFGFLVTGEAVAEPRRVEALRQLLSAYDRTFNRHEAAVSAQGVGAAGDASRIPE
jgi:hypothetical protein